MNSTVLSPADCPPSSVGNKSVSLEEQPVVELHLPLDIQKYEWEKHSTGFARKSLEKLGYKGGGLGKYENGMLEALSVESKEKTIVVSSSIKKGISLYGFNKGYTKGEAMFQRFSGGKVRHIKNYLPTHLEEEKPDSVVIVAGGNDLSSVDGKLSAVATVADDIIEAGNICKHHGTKRVYVSSILPRQSLYYQIHRKKLNDVLRGKCQSHGFIFIENDNIVMKDHVSRDGVHLNVAGSRLLCRNLLNCLNY